MLLMCDLADRNPRLAQPVAGQIHAPGLGVVDDVAGDVGHLEGNAEIGGPVEGVLAPGPHDEGHHHPDHPRDVVAVLAAVVEGLIAPPLDVHGEALQEVEGMSLGDAAAAGDLLEGGERRLLDGLPGEGLRSGSRAGRPRRAGGRNGLRNAPGWCNASRIFMGRYAVELGSKDSYDRRVPLSLPAAKLPGNSA